MTAKQKTSTEKQSDIRVHVVRTPFSQEEMFEFQKRAWEAQRGIERAMHELRETSVVAEMFIIILTRIALDIDHLSRLQEELESLGLVEGSDEEGQDSNKKDTKEEKHEGFQDE